MPADPFVHLRVASGYSLRYGASLPHVLVERAAEHGMDTLGLTDRDGLYGAVRFGKACLASGIRPVLGVDLAVAPSGLLPTAAGPSPGSPRARRTPARGGGHRDRRLPRVTLLATSRRGWAGLCRLVSATHLTGDRGSPVTTLDLVAEHVAGQDVLVLLGPGSEVGRAVTLRRDDLARAVLSRWRAVVGSADLVVEVVSHHLGGSGAGSSPHAARMLRLGLDAQLTTVLGNAVRYADRLDAPTVDVLDATRRLVPLDLRHVDRGNAEAHLKSGKQMTEVAEEVCRLAGLGADATRHLLARTRRVAERCAIDLRADLGLGEVHFPEFDTAGGSADAVLRVRCEAGLARRYGSAPTRAVRDRLDDELAVIAGLGYASYFLTVADVCELIRQLRVRCAARGSGAGSLVNYLLQISGVDPLAHRLLMERFLSPLRRSLPDIDIDVESARRTEVYAEILARFGGDRCTCVMMMDTYRVRHAVRDVGAALGLPPAEIDAIAKAFPHIRAREARAALAALPELRATRLGESGSVAGGVPAEVFFGLVERLDGLPRHVALHPCGVLLSDATLLDRTPVEASYAGFPMSQFDKDDVEDLGLLKLDVLGIRMQSAMAHALDEVERVEGHRLDLDDPTQVPLDDPATFRLVQQAQTLGCFQIESPGQRELVGKFGPRTFADIIIDISLFRPGPVKSDMVTPFLEARHGWRPPVYLHEDLRPFLEETGGVVVFHEQVLEIVATFTGCTLAEADEVRRALSDPAGRPEVRRWFIPRALGQGYAEPTVLRVWEVLEAFASFGFCKAHAAAFAVPTYQSAWLKTHHPAAFFAGVLTHDPGMYPKRLILDDARQHGVPVLPLDVNASDEVFRVERLADRWGIRLALVEVQGISAAEVARIVAGRPYHGLSDLWRRARPSRPVAERLVLAGALDAVSGIAAPAAVHPRGRVTRRDLLLAVADLDRWSRAADRAHRVAAPRTRRRGSVAPPGGPRPAAGESDSAAGGVRARAAAQSQAPAAVTAAPAAQLALDIGGPGTPESAGLPEMTASERVQAELEVLGMDVSQHVVDFYAPFLRALGVTRSRDLLRRRSRADLLVAGVKVATQTPPVRSGRRVVFLTLDDGTGPVDATFFEDAQGPFAPTLFHSWLLLVRGELRRTGPRGVSLRATGCWELATVHRAWRAGGLAAATAAMNRAGSREGLAPGRKLWHASSGSPGR